MSVNDGGPAFPVPSEQRYQDPIHGVIRPSDIYGPSPSGMSLRDYFAGKVLGEASHDLTEPDAIAARAYMIADAMLAKRAKAEGR